MSSECGRLGALSGTRASRAPPQRRDDKPGQRRCREPVNRPGVGPELRTAYGGAGIKRPLCFESCDNAANVLISGEVLLTNALASGNQYYEQQAAAVDVRGA
jgi:hypothetical protein